MSEIAEAVRNAGWAEYQQRLSQLTEREESMLRTAFMAGWHCCALWRVDPLSYVTPGTPPAGADAS